MLFQNIEDLKQFLKIGGNETQMDERLKNLELKAELVSEEEKIEAFEKDLEEIEQIVHGLINQHRGAWDSSHGSGLSDNDKTTRDIRRMLRGATAFMSKLEQQLSELKDSQSKQLGRKHNNDLDDEEEEEREPVNPDFVDDLPDELQVPTEDEFNHFTLPYYFDRELEKHQHGRTNLDNDEKSSRKIGANLHIGPASSAKEDERPQAFEDDQDDPATIAVISVSIIVVAGILVTVLAVYCCKRCQYQRPTSSSNQNSYAYTSDDFEKEEDVYLEDFGEGDFFEWPKTPVRLHQEQQQQRPQQQPQRKRQQKHLIVEFSRGFSEGYCRLTTERETTQL